MIRDLIVDMEQFYENYRRVEPYLQNDSLPPTKERLQSPEDREKLDGLYECICVLAAQPPAPVSGGTQTSS